MTGARGAGARRRAAVVIVLVLAAAACGREQPRDLPGAVHAAVAANFEPAFRELARAFTDATGVPVAVSVGSTGKLYAQIVNGAPFHVLFAADAARPARLVEEGHAVAGSRFTYAVGRLALIGAGVAGAPDVAAALRAGDGPIAVASPAAAPYGAAALEVLERLGLEARGAGRLVFGESVGQAWQFAASGAADLGFVALSQVRERAPVSHLDVSTDLHAPIVQDAVLLEAGQDVEGARELLAFIASPAARPVLERYGYRTPAESHR